MELQSYSCCPKFAINFIRYNYNLTSVAPNGVGHFHIRTKFPHLLDDLTDLQSELVRWHDAKALREANSYWWGSIFQLLQLQVDTGWPCRLHVMLTWVHLLAVFTWLSMAREKAAVLPVPDCDWAIRFWGLEPEKHTHEYKVKLLQWVSSIKSKNNS